MMIENIVSFLPLFIIKNQWESSDGFVIDENDISLIIAVFAVAQIIFSPLNSRIKNKLGAKNTILFGLTLMMITCVGLGSIARIKDPKHFLIIAIILRFF
jgi:fucose permease